jgi:hypothetical protein
VRSSHYVIGSFEPNFRYTGLYGEPQDCLRRNVSIRKKAPFRSLYGVLTRSKVPLRLSVVSGPLSVVRANPINRFGHGCLEFYVNFHESGDRRSGQPTTDNKQRTRALSKGGAPQKLHHVLSTGIFHSRLICAPGGVNRRARSLYTVTDGGTFLSRSRGEKRKNHPKQQPVKE